MGRCRGHAPLDIKPVCAAVERHPRFVDAGLRRQQPHLRGGDVWRVGDQQIDSAVEPSWQRLVEVAVIHPRVAARLRRAHRTATGSMSTANNSTGCRVAAKAAPTAPEPQPRSTTISRLVAVPSSGEAATRSRCEVATRPRAVASRTRNSVRRRGRKTPGTTAMRRPQNWAQPRTCSRGSPATRRCTIASRSAGVRAASMSNCASSSAKTQPADRSLVTMADRGHGATATALTRHAGWCSRFCLN